MGIVMFDCMEMFDHACAFCECADLARDKGRSSIRYAGFFGVAVGVNSAFDCEVFLKLLLKLYSINNKKCHNLKSLFELLPNHLQENIKTHLQACHLWKDALGQDNLDKVSDAFQKWRYVYEHDYKKGALVIIDCGFLNIFRDLLREICCKELFSRSWEEYKKSVWG